MMIKLKVESLKLKGLCLAAILFFNLNAFAQTTFEQANAAYADGRYEDAAAGYEALLAEAPDATLYYNLGNARYKQGELAQAILNYERYDCDRVTRTRSTTSSSRRVRSRITSSSRISSCPHGRALCAIV